MTRQIKFRGFGTRSKEWVFGDLIHGVGFKKGRMFILPPVQNLAYVKDCDPLDGVEVELDSIGQFTGLTDKNGVEIYESDIVATPIGDDQSTGIVRYEISEFGIEWIRESSLLGVWGQRHGLRSLSDTLVAETELTVIGNVHQNPELLEATND